MSTLTECGSGLSSEVERTSPTKRRGPAIKHCWRGVFNYSREIRVLYCHATTKDAAWVKLCHRLAKIYGVEPYTVMQRFNRKYGNFTIEKEIEYQEVPNE